MNLEDYIKNLAPDLQEKARACGSVEELLALARENEIPLPDETLAAIAGGDDPENGKCWPSNPDCPRCCSSNVKFDNYDLLWICNNCGYEWRA